MAEIVQSQLRKFEQLTKPYLYEGPFSSQWGFVEQKLNHKLKRDQIVLGLLGVLILYLAFGWGNDFLCNLIGFLYPAYASLTAVDSSTASNGNTWLIYWVIYASFGFVEYLGHEFFRTLLFYWLGKTAFLLWLMVPGQKNGSRILYERLIHPLLSKCCPPAASKPVPESDSYGAGYYSSVVNDTN